jgi:hypothetical protein
MQRIFYPLAGMLLGMLLLVAPAHAYTPESGVWWNPNEPGSGLQIEIQDNFVAVFVYAYDTAGNAQWYTANGFLTGNARFDGVLDRFTGGATLGGAWRPNTFIEGAGGPIRIDFNANDPTRATLTMGGRSRQIERFHFYLQRPEDRRDFPNIRVEVTKMLGEWQAVLDYTDHTTASVRGYYGEVLVFDDLVRDGGDFAEGCRAADSEIGFCRNIDFQNHRAVARYVASSGEHIIVVDNNATTFAAYFVQVGTNHFRGEVSVYPKGSNPTVYYPTRGFRTASRSFVEEGVGPSKRLDGDGAPTATPLPLTEGTGGKAARALDADTLAALRELEAALEAGGAR